MEGCARNSEPADDHVSMGASDFSVMQLCFLSLSLSGRRVDVYIISMVPTSAEYF